MEDGGRRMERARREFVPRAEEFQFLSRLRDVEADLKRRELESSTRADRGRWSDFFERKLK
jgi:hypothetical protein